MPERSAYSTSTFLKFLLQLQFAFFHLGSLFHDSFEAFLDSSMIPEQGHLPTGQALGTVELHLYDVEMVVELPQRSLPFPLSSSLCDVAS